MHIFAAFASAIQACGERCRALEESERAVENALQELCATPGTSERCKYLVLNLRRWRRHFTQQGRVHICAIGCFNLSSPRTSRAPGSPTERVHSLSVLMITASCGSEAQSGIYQRPWPEQSAIAADPAHSSAGTCRTSRGQPQRGVLRTTSRAEKHRRPIPATTRPRPTTIAHAAHEDHVPVTAAGTAVLPVLEFKSVPGAAR